MLRNRTLARIPESARPKQNAENFVLQSMGFCKQIKTFPTIS